MNHKNRSDTPIAICPTTRAVTLSSPTALPKACGFLYNQDMMIQMNCRGYAVAQHLNLQSTVEALTLKLPRSCSPNITTIPTIRGVSFI
jgi:hypothetical protein